MVIFELSLLNEFWNEEEEKSRKKQVEGMFCAVGDYALGLGGVPLRI